MITLIDTTSTDHHAVSPRKILRVVMRHGSEGHPQGIDRADAGTALRMTAGDFANHVAVMAMQDAEAHRRAPASYRGHSRAWYVLDADTQTYWRTAVEGA